MRAWIAVVLAVAGTASAQESLDALPPGTDHDIVGGAEANGYLMNRLGYAEVDPAALAAVGPQPSVTELAEANVQLRVNLGARHHFAFLDLSLLYQGGWGYLAEDGAGGRRRLRADEAPALQPAVTPSELYVSSSPRPWLNLLAGRKRIVWGPGVAFNPMDLINPAKDPTDPSAQRAGAWVARVELPQESFTFTALFAPQPLLGASGLPSALLRYPASAADTAPGYDDEAHYLAAARLYALVADTDVNVVYFFSNRYLDAFEDKSRLGLSFSRVVFSGWELHAEVLLSRGSARRFPVPGCAADPAACTDVPAFALRRLEERTVFPRWVVGTRRQVSSDSFLALEYYFQGDGYSDAEFADALVLMAAARARGRPEGTGGAAAAGALPQRYTFEPLRQHYLMASYSAARLLDDWTVNASLIAGLRDLSGLISGSVSWSAREWLTLTASAYAPIRGLGVGEVRVGDQRLSEYALQPYQFRFLFEATAYF